MPKILRVPEGEAEAVAVPVGDAPVVFGGATVGRSGEQSVLFVPPNVPILVNGRPVPAGIRVLADHDQVHAGAEAWWFSAADPPRVMPFPGGANAVCPRCRRPIAGHDPAVRCGCGTWFHESAELP